MAKRHSKTVAQQCRYYEVDNIFECKGQNENSKRDKRDETIVK